MTTGEHVEVLRNMLSGLSIHAKESEEVNYTILYFMNCLKKCFYFQFDDNRKQMRATSQSILKDCKQILSEIDRNDGESETEEGDETMSADSADSDDDLIDDDEEDTGSWNRKKQVRDSYEEDESDQELEKRKSPRKKIRASKNNAIERAGQSKAAKDDRRDREIDAEDEKEDDPEPIDDARNQRKKRKEEISDDLEDEVNDLTPINEENEITDNDITELEKEGGFIPIAKKKVEDVSGAITARKIFFTSSTR